MANLTEQNTWELGIYRIEENDPVHGGENGITNRPTKQLANRTQYLYQRKLDKTGGEITGNLNITGILGISDIRHTLPLSLYTPTGNAQKIYTGGILASSSYADANKIPDQGIYAKGNVQTAGSFIGNLQGNAATATKLQTARTVTIGGAVSGSFSYDGSQNSHCTLTLANSGVQSGTYGNSVSIPSISINEKGLISSVSTQAIRHASTTQTGIVQLNDTLTSTANNQALTANQGRNLSLGKLDKTENAVSASKLQTPRQIQLTGAVTGSVNFDGSQNVQIATTLQSVVRETRSGIIMPNSHSNMPIQMTGTHETYPDGRIVQRFTFECPVIYFHKSNVRNWHMQKLGLQDIHAPSDFPIVELPLWRAMPNKILEARLQISQTIAHSTEVESLEWNYSWQSIFQHRLNEKSNVYFGFRRLTGGTDEPVRFDVVVEGY